VSDPFFLSFEQILLIHERQIALYGGKPGVRDRAGLESAVFQPQNVFLYGQGDIYDIAAAYAFHIAQAQAFLDGNKRTAMSAALQFLDINGIHTHEATAPLHQAMIDIANHTLSKAGLATVLRDLFPA
jgi:death-on-curing protein